MEIAKYISNDKLKEFCSSLKKYNIILKDLTFWIKENLKNKQKVRSYLNRIYQTGKSKIDENVKNYFSEDVSIKCFFPLNEFRGLSKFKDNFWLPLFEAFPDIERREHLVIGGAFRDKIQVGSISTLSGVFKNVPRLISNLSLHLFFQAQSRT